MVEEKRDEWGIPKLVCPQCNGYIYESDNVESRAGVFFHRECLHVLKRSEENERKAVNNEMFRGDL